MRPPATLRLRRALRAGAALLLIGLLTGCMLPPTPATDAGQDVFNVYVAILIMAAIVFVGVEGFIVYAIVRYRRAPGDDTLPPQTHGNTQIEIIWTAIPTVIVLILFVISTLTLATVEARAPEPGVLIEAEGFQWQWNFRYDDGDGDTENDLVITGTAGEPPTMGVPVGEPIRVTLPSRDVIHAFYVPNFLIKRDVIPVGEHDTPNEMEFTITEPGTYAGQCAEFCGELHADMTFTVEAMSRADYDTWLEAMKSGEEPAPSVPPDAQVIELSATGVEFSTDSLEVPAGVPFIIRFEITDAQNHNVSIYPPGGGDPLFEGEIFQGPDVREYVVPPLEPGEYEFICDVHPTTMVGTLVASE
jgi:cytochrome c oxidase subunit 2